FLFPDALCADKPRGRTAATPVRGAAGRESFVRGERPAAPGGRCWALGPHPDEIAVLGWPASLGGDQPPVAESALPWRGRPDHRLREGRHDAGDCVAAGVVVG